MQATATLSGTGTVGGTLTPQSGGTPAPGTSTDPGTLTVGGGLTLSSGSTSDVGLNGTTAGTLHDRLTVTGGVNLTGANLNVLIGYTPAAAGDLLFLIVNDESDPITGTFAGWADGSTFAVAGRDVTISYIGNLATNSFTGGNDVVARVFPVPEPGAVLPVSAAGSGLVRRVARRV